jgi:hypothetical protein
MKHPEEEGGGCCGDNGPGLGLVRVSLARLDLTLNKQEVFLMVW